MAEVLAIIAIVLVVICALLQGVAVLANYARFRAHNTVLKGLVEIVEKLARQVDELEKKAEEVRRWN